MPSHGSRPDHQRCRQAAKWLAIGLSYTEIGRRLGNVPKQTIACLLAPPTASTVVVSCEVCGTVVARGRYQRRTLGKVLCSHCPAARPWHVPAGHVPAASHRRPGPRNRLSQKSRNRLSQKAQSSEEETAGQRRRRGRRAVGRRAPCGAPPHRKPTRRGPRCNRRT
jgi:hypothetical protein